ncbi:MAG: hypothetical protein AVDCRST_MAG49-35 [uncultured Thermomicrobiales bacterium]|uniref:Uncharacterized protein n=1 Tax=uncultured Thermomicrobiales bacterium TaxID=1645740 RepID=A0A6J4TVJ1_9BACT|nr:MAG: hypothetical protein AVDCRST_MAG49-35 [uncultured Thermomicrobiales bacterium]
MARRPQEVDGPVWSRRPAPCPSSLLKGPAPADTPCLCGRSLEGSCRTGRTDRLGDLLALG